MQRPTRSPILLSLLAAALFGASAPLAKYLLGDVEPVLLAGLLYLGSGLSVLLWRVFRRNENSQGEIEAHLVRADLPWLAGAVLAGGVAAPILLLVSLQITPAATASLLLNFESVATTLIAVLFFGEAAGRRTWSAVLLITLASVVLSLTLTGGWRFSGGALGILGACMLWGLDNNLTRQISNRDPLSIVMVKGLGAGCVSLLLATCLGTGIPPVRTILGALLLGSLSYGASIALFVRALRGLGAARTSALFSTAPLAGVMLSVVLFREIPAWTFPVALALMAAGTWLLVSEKHAHFHLHPASEHDHAHNHTDGHHEHLHADGFSGSHSHLHAHVETSHSHPHAPDIHHRHEHIHENDQDQYKNNL